MKRWGGPKVDKGKQHLPSDSDPSWNEGPALDGPPPINISEGDRRQTNPLLESNGTGEGSLAAGELDEIPLPAPLAGTENPIQPTGGRKPLSEDFLPPEEHGSDFTSTGFQPAASPLPTLPTKGSSRKFPNIDSHGSGLTPIGEPRTPNLDLPPPPPLPANHINKLPGSTPTRTEPLSRPVHEVPHPKTSDSSPLPKLNEMPSSPSLNSPSQPLPSLGGSSSDLPPAPIPAPPTPTTPENEGLKPLPPLPDAPSAPTSPTTPTNAPLAPLPTLGEGN